MQKAIVSELFGKLVSGEEVTKYTLTNDKESSVSILNYGGIITHLYVRDRQGNLQDIVLGYDHLEGYLEKSPYFGAIIGRYGNRIAKGKFSLGDSTYNLAINNMGNHLHGGIKGFDKHMWHATAVPSADGPILKLERQSPDGEEGYPGNLDCIVTYQFTHANALKIDYFAKTDRKTVINLTNHSYFNLSGNPKQPITDHLLKINAESFIPVDSTLIPMGNVASVHQTPFEFSEFKQIGAQIDANHEQIKIGGGYDHTFVVRGEEGSLRDAAWVYHPGTGIYMTVRTTEPGVQFYTGNFLDGTIKGKNDVRYNKRSAFCLETQHFPDSPNQRQFPSVILTPGKAYTSTTEYIFSVRD